MSRWRGIYIHIYSHISEEEEKSDQIEEEE